MRKGGEGDGGCIVLAVVTTLSVGRGWVGLVLRGINGVVGGSWGGGVLSGVLTKVVS